MLTHPVFTFGESTPLKRGIIAFIPLWRGEGAKRKGCVSLRIDFLDFIPL